MSKINTPPIGLQSLLGSQSFGDNPDDLLNGVRGSLDLLPFYSAVKGRFKSNSGARGSAGSFCKTTMGGGVGNEGEAGLLLGASVNLAIIAGGANFSGGIRLDNLPNISVPMWLQHTEYSTGTAPLPGSDFSALTWWAPQPIYLPNDAEVEAYATSLDANVTATLTIYYIQLLA